VYDDIREADVLCRLSCAAYAAFSYAVQAPLARLFAFELSDPEDRELFAKAAETYLLSHLGHGFDTLNFYHSMRALSEKTASTPQKHEPKQDETKRTNTNESL
jgi:hypothetical protein